MKCVVTDALKAQLHNAFDFITSRHRKPSYTIVVLGPGQSPDCDKALIETFYTFDTKIGYILVVDMTSEGEGGLWRGMRGANDNEVYEFEKRPYDKSIRLNDNKMIWDIVVYSSESMREHAENDELFKKVLQHSVKYRMNVTSNDEMACVDVIDMMNDEGSKRFCAPVSGGGGAKVPPKSTAVASKRKLGSGMKPRGPTQR